MRPTTLLVVDRHPVVGLGLRALLVATPDLRVVGQVCTALETVDRARCTRPDLILLGLQLPDGRASELCRRLHVAMPAARVVIFSACAEDGELHACLAWGVAGVLLKDIGELELVGALRRLRTGDMVVDDRVRARVAPATRPPRPRTSHQRAGEHGAGHSGERSEEASARRLGPAFRGIDQLVTRPYPGEAQAWEGG
jgi:DNA-binding NarL/FixJ family response regulator